MFTNFNDMSPWYEDMDYLDALYCLPLRDWLAMDQKQLGFMALKVEILHHLLEGVQHFIHQLQSKGK